MKRKVKINSKSYLKRKKLSIALIIKEYYNVINTL